MIPSLLLNAFACGMSVGITLWCIADKRGVFLITFGAATLALNLVLIGLALSA